jgi:hypothetical protein
MTTMTTTPTPVGTTTRWLGYLAPIGPLAMAGWALALPYHVGDATDVWIPKVAESAGRTQLSFWMLLLFALTAGVGAIVTGLVARRGSLRLGTVGMALAFLGFSALSFSGAGYDGAAFAGMRSGLDLAATERLMSEVDTIQAPLVGSMVFMPLMAVGVVLLGVALWRGRTVPRWAAAAVVAAFPIVFAGGVVAMPLNAAGWLLMALGFGAAGVAYARS